MIKSILLFIGALVVIYYVAWPIAVFLVKLLFGITVGLIAIILKLAFIAGLCYIGYLGWKVFVKKPAN